MTIVDRLLGRPLATHEEEHHRIGVVAGIPVLGLDALSSCAYGPEAALTVLLPLGAAGIAYAGPITAVILLLLFILYLSYRQTITAYPDGGGSYTVARENLGPRMGLLAAAALLLDYVLNVAVGISAGVEALGSAFPVLQPRTLSICLLILILITWVNLRGVRESGIVFAAPTYLFVATLLIVLAIGATKALSGNVTAILPPSTLPPATETVSLWLLMRAFASGCTAMTGVEAVSNGVPAFRQPRVQTAQKTLTAIIVLLAVLLAGIAWLAIRYRIGAPVPDAPNSQSVISQLVAAVCGRGWFYFLTMGSVLSVLALSANTSFADFPRLCQLLARDDYLPRPFANRGRRLVFSGGILVLATLSGVLLIIFGGITDRLIPLFAVGAFGAFTLSQFGMVVHWKQTRAWTPLAVNLLGACTTLVALIVILSAKFLDGAWITLVIIPGVLWLCTRTRHHYKTVAHEIASASPIHLDDMEAPVVVVPIKGWNQITEKGLRFALRISDTVHCVYVTSNIEDAAQLREAFTSLVVEPIRQRQHAVPHLNIVEAPYRDLFRPLLRFVDEIKREYPTRTIAVIIPELIERRWWQHLLHNKRAMQLKAAFMLFGDQRVSVINVPWYLHQPTERDTILRAKVEDLLSES